jgi:hypothetical protein
MLDIQEQKVSSIGDLERSSDQAGASQWAPVARQNRLVRKVAEIVGYDVGPIDLRNND